VAFAELATELEPTVNKILKGDYALPSEPHHVFFIFSAIMSKIKDDADVAVQHYEYVEFLANNQQRVAAAVGYADVARGYPLAYRVFKQKATDVYKRLVRSLGKLVEEAVLEAEERKK
jgi:hypothetical protein